MPTRSASRDPASTAFLLVEQLTNGALSEFQARRRMADFVHEMEQQRADEREQAALEAAGRGPTFRELAHAWLEYVEFVRNAKPSTLRDYRSMLAEPNAPYRRGRGRAVGRVMGAIGDLPACDVTTADVERILMAHAVEGVGARSVNKHRQTLAAIFNFGLRPEQEEQWRLTKNPAAMAAKRREDPPARMEVFTVEQVELLARTAEATDPQLGEMVRLAAYTGLRRGELVTLKWRDVRWGERVLVVERALSGGVEGTTKSRRARYVPLADQALGPLDRLSSRVPPLTCLARCKARSGPASSSSHSRKAEFAALASGDLRARRRHARRLVVVPCERVASSIETPASAKRQRGTTPCMDAALLPLCIRKPKQRNSSCLGAMSQG